MNNRFFYILFLLLTFVNFKAFSQTGKEAEINSQTAKFKSLLETVDKYYYDTVSIKKISETAFSAMLKTLDNYSDYYSAELNKLLIQRNQGAGIGVGLGIHSVNDTITVISIQKDSPADSAGLKTGDKLLFINGSRAVGMTNEQANLMMENTSTNIVSLVVKRGYANVLLEFNLPRTTIQIPSVTAIFVIGGTDIAYLKLNRFSATTHSEIVNSLEKLKENGFEKIVLDLRENAGGDLEQCIKVADEFLMKDKKIVYTEARDTVFKFNYKADGNGRYQTVPFVIMLDAGSASASEIIAAAMQENDRALIVGVNSLGKGLVQRKWDFTDSSSFIFTIAQYFTPLGRTIQKINNPASLDVSSKLSLKEEKIKEIEKLLAQSGGTGRLKTFTTPKGRAIIETGGILPDYIIEEDTLTLLTMVIKQKSIFLEFAYNYLFAVREKIIEQTNNDYRKFNEQFNISQEMLDEFKALVRSKNIWNEEMFQKDKNYIFNFLKATIAHSLWGIEAFYYCTVTLDKPLSKAIEIMPEAEKLIK